MSLGMVGLCDEDEGMSIGGQTPEMGAVRATFGFIKD